MRSSEFRKFLPREQLKRFIGKINLKALRKSKQETPDEPDSGRV